MRTCLLIGISFLLVACAGPQPASGVQVTDKWQAPADTKPWRVDPAASELEIRVYRAGPLASFGHNHVIEFPVEGTVHRGATVAGSGFRLVIPVLQAVIDDPVARREAGKGFEATVSGQARAGTRRNMLGPDMLDADSHAQIVVESGKLDRKTETMEATVWIHVRGQVFEKTIPFNATFRDSGMEITADFELTQSALGIEQYTALGGGLQVRDAMEFRLHVIANHP